MVITTNTSLSVRTEIREALKSFNTNPFSTAGLHEDALNAEDEILMQISDQTKRVTLQDIDGYIGANLYNTNSSNYIEITSNLLATNTNLYNTNSSNYIALTSNLLATNTNLNNNNNSNYIEITSNLLSTNTNLNNTNTSNYIETTSNLLATNTNLYNANSSNYVASTSNLLATNTNLLTTNSSNYIETTSNLLATNTNLNNDNSSNYIKITSNLLANADILIQNELNILENIILPTGKTFLNNDKKTISIGYKDRVSLNYNAIADAFIIPLKQVNKVIDDNNAGTVLNYLINRPFLYVVANILQVDDNYSMVKGIVAYLLDNNNTTFSFTKKLSITISLNTLCNLYDIGDNSLSYTRTANNLNLTFKQQTIRDFLTTNIYLNQPSLPASFTPQALWIIPNSIFSNWNVSPRRYSVPNVLTSPTMLIDTGKDISFLIQQVGWLDILKTLDFY